MKPFRSRSFLLLSFALLSLGVSPTRADAWRPVGDNLKTGWAAQVDPDRVLPEYPRPELARPDWQNLNSLWDYAITDAAAAEPTSWDGKILVPFCVESSLSGVGRRISGSQSLWYRREFSAKRPPDGGHLLLHFGACDWRTTVFLNGVPVGEHAGGYDPFTFDLTPYLRDGGTQTLTVQVSDATDEEASDQPRGKQSLRAGDPGYFFGVITYTPATGIWQTVWLEEVSNVFVERLEIKPDLEGGTVEVTAVTPDGSGPVTVDAFAPTDATGEKGDAPPVAHGTGVANAPVRLSVPGVQAWSPDHPALYHLEVTCGPDRVRSYFGFRTIERRKGPDGTERVFLNGRPVFLYGPLDQGFWPDGVYTAPTDEALQKDLDLEKAYGFNCVRKHIKVEPSRWYYWADRKGLLVWQDFPAVGPVLRDVDTKGKPDFQRSPAAKAQIEGEMHRMVENLSCHPSVVVWTVFNEAWGQYDTGRVSGLFRRWDRSRLVDEASGWNDRGGGDFLDEHDYGPPARDARGNGPFGSMQKSDRAVVLGEFGGRGLNNAALGQPEIKDHLWKAKERWAYEQLPSRDALTKAVLAAIARTDALAREGLSGAIYTQLTDVEGEVNGLVTYDRAVAKVAPEAVRGAIQATIRDGSVERAAPGQ